MQAPTRRVFLRRVAGGSLATVAGMALLPRASEAGKPGPVPAGSNGGKPVAGAMGGDLDILNFALLLERLEAAFYNQNAGKPYLTGGGTKTGTSLTALLSGNEETPPVNSAATAMAHFSLSDDQTQLTYDVQVMGLASPAIAMHLHRGARGAPGDIVYTLNTPFNGMAAGMVTLNPADLAMLLNQGFYLNIHTQNYPGGEIRGQVSVAASAAPGGTATTLKGLVDEIRDHENAHVMLLQGALGGNAQPTPAFQNLDAPTLQQFLVMAQMFEDVGVSAYLGQVPLIQDHVLLAEAAAIMAVEARHAGGLRAYRKGAGAADGGDPTITLTEEREPVNRARTREQVLALIQPYLGASTTNPSTPANPTPGTGTPNY